MPMRFSESGKGVIGIAGHAGCGHCHSHNQYAQDDSGGLAVALALFQEASGLPLTIREVRTVPGVDGSITVETASGGIGVAQPRRGVTVHEARLAKCLEGRDAIRTQALIMEAFGRFYGQGAHETPVALQTAVANAAVDSFVRNFPGRFACVREDIAHCCGLIAGTVLELDGVPVSVLATVNAAADGTGPVEDLEGNVFGGAKKTVMRRLGMEDLPTIVVEGKVYSPLYSDDVDADYYLVRADPLDDNPVVAAALTRAAGALGYAATYRDDVMKRVPGALENATKALGDAIADAGLRLKDARFSREKVAVLAELARLVSEDGAGISFMSDRLHEIVGGIGLMPGSAAVVSHIVPKSYRDSHVMPFLTEGDVGRFAALVKRAVRELNEELPAAREHLRGRAFRGDLDQLLSFPPDDQ